MAEHRCRPRRRYTPDPAMSLEPEDVHMTRYISHCVPPPCACVPNPCACQETRALLEQLAALSAQQCQLLIDLLGAVNSLTAATLTAQARVDSGFSRPPAPILPQF